MSKEDGTKCVQSMYTMSDQLAAPMGAQIAFLLPWIGSTHENRGLHFDQTEGEFRKYLAMREEHVAPF